MLDGREVLRLFKARWLRHCAAGALIGALHIPLAFAQDGQTVVSKTTPSNPPPVVAAPAVPAPAAKPAIPAASTSAWHANVAQPPQPAPAAAPAVPQETDQQIVTKVNDYFNKLTDLQGVFLQTDPDGKQKRGRFYFQRPGKIRFDYAPPSSLKIVSDGRNLAIEDKDMNTSERYPLDVTPFKLLLSETVDLANDAKVTAIEQGPDFFVLTAEEKGSEGSSGRIRLFFSKPDMVLKEWIITDAQGLDTRLEISELEQNKKVTENYFIISAFGLDRDR
ncbi:MAG: LolA family protein [Rhodomicrobium sp.]